MLPSQPFTHRTLPALLPRAKHPKAEQEVPLPALPNRGGAGGRGRLEQIVRGAEGSARLRSSAAAGELWHSPPARFGSGQIAPQNRRPWQTGSGVEKLPVPACLLKNTTPAVPQPGRPCPPLPSPPGLPPAQACEHRSSSDTSEGSLGLLCQKQHPR